MIIARPLVAGVEEVRTCWSPHANQPWSSWACWHRKSHGARPLDVGLKHAAGLHSPLGMPRTLPCLTLGWTIGFWPPPSWQMGWQMGWSWPGSKKEAPAPTRWSDRPQCSAARQNAVLEMLLQLHAQTPSGHSGSDEQSPQQSAPPTEAPAAATVEQAPLDLARPAESEAPQAADGAAATVVVQSTLSSTILSQPLEPLTLEEHRLQEQNLPEGLAPHLPREDSEWSFLSQSLRTCDSVDLNEDEDSSEDDRPNDAPRWRRMRDYIWRTTSFLQNNAS